MADPPKCKLVTKKMLKGHINKVNSVHYSGDSRYIMTAGQMRIRYSAIFPVSFGSNVKNTHAQYASQTRSFRFVGRQADNMGHVDWS